MSSVKCPKCGLYFNRALSIDALIVQDNKILLINRANEPFKSFWALPGGHVDWDETITNAIHREVKEETNLDVKKVTLMGEYSNPARHLKQTVALAYIVDVVENLPLAGGDSQECKYFSFDLLPSKMAFDHLEIIKDYLSWQQNS